MTDSSNVSFDCKQIIQLMLVDFFFFIRIYIYNYILNDHLSL